MFKNQSILLPEALKQKNKNFFPALETFECPFNSTKTESGIIRITFPEFTCVCPKTGYPDFATIDLAYQPGRLCLELKSWKLFLNSFRMVGTFHETVTAHLFKTVTTLLKPRWLLLVGDFLPRGNVNTTVFFETNGTRPPSADFAIGAYMPHCKKPGE